MDWKACSFCLNWVINIIKTQTVCQTVVVVLVLNYSPFLCSCLDDDIRSQNMRKLFFVCLPVILFYLSIIKYENKIKPTLNILLLPFWPGQRKTSGSFRTGGIHHVNTAHLQLFPGDTSVWWIQRDTLRQIHLMNKIEIKIGTCSCIWPNESCKGH